jgi:vancomycin resistance protein YoaR
VPAKPAVKPAQPAKPAEKPMTAKPLELLLDTTEPEIRGGQLRELQLTRAFAMPQNSVSVSRKATRISSGLEDAMRGATRSLRRDSQNALWVFDKTSRSWVARQSSSWSVDLDATKANVLEALKYNKSSAKIVVRRNPPARNVQDWYARGIRYYFGGGQSNFFGSPPFRVQNIVAGSRQLDNVYIAPGEVFDFNRRVQISTQLGFVDGYIIKGGLLEKDIGGGICQVSTTLFRAAYNAGLPITQRNFHSYRVHYYDPVGFEATVFSPYKNLKFRNDSGSPLFMQVTWYTRAQRLEINFFGAKPDRRTTVSAPYVYNVRPAPRARFVPDPTVRLGRIKRISGAERGMNVRITRTVRYNTGRNQTDYTNSSYVPWGEIYAVNPRDYRVAAKPRPPSAFVVPAVPKINVSATASSRDHPSSSMAMEEFAVIPSASNRKKITARTGPTIGTPRA